MEDEEIERAIRRDPKPLVIAAVGIVVALGLMAYGLVGFGRLRVGERAARGFSTITEVPGPRP